MIHYNIDILGNWIIKALQGNQSNIQKGEEENAWEYRYVEYFSARKEKNGGA